MRTNCSKLFTKSRNDTLPCLLTLETICIRDNESGPHCFYSKFAYDRYYVEKSTIIMVFDVTHFYCDISSLSSKRKGIIRHL